MGGSQLERVRGARKPACGLRDRRQPASGEKEWEGARYKKYGMGDIQLGRVSTMGGGELWGVRDGR